MVRSAARVLCRAPWEPLNIQQDRCPLPLNLQMRVIIVMRSSLIVRFLKAWLMKSFLLRWGPPDRAKQYLRRLARSSEALQAFFLLADMA